MLRPRLLPYWLRALMLGIVIGVASSTAAGCAILGTDRMEAIWHKLWNANPS